MVEAVMLWNEPNNLAHWNFTLDPDWALFARMISCAAQAIRAENASLPIALGGISPIDPWFIQNMRSKGALEHMDIVAVHGFPFDWNHWTVREWPDKITLIGELARKSVWVTEAGVSTFGADEIQEIGLKLTAPILLDHAKRVYWYSLFDLPRSWEAVAHRPQAQDSEYMRHFHMGLLRQDGTSKASCRLFADYTPELGICQWFHLHDHRLRSAVRWMKRLGVKRLRTGLSWADSLADGGPQWYDLLMRTVEPFDTCITFCFTPESKGIVPHHTSPPKKIEEFASFCASMVRRYAG
ncbi:MAG: beta-xylosidase [Chitinivibrionales bacterium]|nr:beta-xylosidase [Chitinivibrionales bacterium]